MKTELRLLKNTQKYRKTPKGLLTNIYQRIKNRCLKYEYSLDFTLKDIHILFLNDKKFIKLFKFWEKNGYKYYDVPTIDRIDAYKGYEKNNIQILSWLENRKKGDKECAIKKWKPIIMTDMDGNKIKRFESIKRCANETGLNYSLIILVCQGKRNHTGGYKFIYDNPELLDGKATC